MNAILYSTGCPKCKVLTKKLDMKNIQYTVNNSQEDMIALGITQVPVLSINNKLYNFTEAVKFVNEYNEGGQN